MALKSSWLERLFGLEKPQDPPSDSETHYSVSENNAISSEQVGLNGEPDPSGLAKRVALAFDEDPDVEDIETVYLSQKGSIIALKGKVPSQEALDKLVRVAKTVNGATGVEVDQVTVGSTVLGSGSGTPDA